MKQTYPRNRSFFDKFSENIQICKRFFQYKKVYLDNYIRKTLTNIVTL